MKVDAKVNFDGLKKLKSALSSNLETKVGIISGSKERTNEGGINNATLGMIHEFGSFAKGLPARSWLRMPIEQKSDEIQQDIIKASDSIEESFADGNAEALYEALGLAAEKQIQTSFETGGFGQWKGNSPSTQRSKGSSSPLIDTGQLRESIITRVLKRDGK